MGGKKWHESDNELRKILNVKKTQSNSDMIDFEKYGIAGIRKKLYGKSIRATLFGKFYEKILECYFETYENFRVFKNKPLVLLDHVKGSSILKREEYEFIKVSIERLKKLEGRKYWILIFFWKRTGKTS